MTPQPQPSFTNRLIHEKSPYLLQHAHNPVDWFPWGKEAFELAKSQDKPIFLSIGYATCHWCHAMEKESFEDPEVAKLMNEVFVNIKVDREELPEVDSIYMEIAQALMSSAGGWPLNLVLTSDLKPFFAVTYLPPHTRRGLMGLYDFVLQIKKLWHSDERPLLVEQANKLVELFSKSAHPKGDEIPSEKLIFSAVEHIFENADPVYGGIKGEPKFPMSYQSNFLLNFSKLRGDNRSLFYAELTLDSMRRGGIYDHLGGGFSRYAVDERWLIPHFEKMSYDNALLSTAYLEAWRYTKKQDYRDVCEETLRYILREMTHPEGGVYSAEDADSEGQEGLYYTWTLFEVQSALTPLEAEQFCQYYGVTREGNFEGRSILHIETPLEEYAEKHSLPVDQLRQTLSDAKSKLLQKRENRIHPLKDDKIITAWNGLMIHSLVKAGRAFNEQTYIEKAIQSAEFIQKNLWKERCLYRRWRENDARFRGVLEDYAFLIRGLLSLFEEDCGTKWLTWALELTAILENNFKSEEGGAFFQTDGQEDILIRKSEFYDGAEPSGNGVHADNLLRLFQMTQNEKYLSDAENIFMAGKEHLETFAPGSCFHLMALQRYLDTKAVTLIIALDELQTLKKEIKEALSTHFSPHTVLIWKKQDDKQINELIPFFRDKVPVDGQTTVYICRQALCEAPLIQKEDILKAIRLL